MVIRAVCRIFAALARITTRLLGQRPVSFRGGSVNAQNIERSFKTVFHMLPQSRREDLIMYYQRRMNCTRIQAMGRAIEDRARDNGLRM